MKKLYDEFFYIPKDGKIREKVMLARVAKTVFVMVFCLVAMGVTAYAYFSYNITSDTNVIRAVGFKTNVVISETEQRSAEPVVVSTNNNVNHSASLAAGKRYKIDVSLSSENTANTGFIILRVDNTDIYYHTQQLGVDGSKHTDAISFFIEADTDIDVTLESHWGTSAFYGYGNEENPLYIETDDTVELKFDVSQGDTSSDNPQEEENSELQNEDEKNESQAVDSEESSSQEPLISAPSETDDVKEDDLESPTESNVSSSAKVEDTPLISAQEETLEESED